MKTSLRFKVVVLMTFCILLNAQTHAQDTVDKKEILATANKAYYSLKDHGFKGFQCSVNPNWKKLVEDNYNREFPPLNLLSQIEFSASVDKDGTAKVDPFNRDGSEIDRRLNNTVGGIQQMISGFYQTWTSLVIQPPFFGPDEDFKIKDEGNNYLITSGGVQVLMSKNFLISEMSIPTPTAKVVIWPKYTKTDKGLLLTSIISDINEGQMKVSFQIHYQEIEGFELPANVLYNVITPNRTISADVSFVNYHLTKQ